MHKYRGSNLIRAGFMGVAIIVLTIAVGLGPERIWSWATAVRYKALFSEAGGLKSGDDVTVSGIKVGSVSNVSLKGGDVLVTFSVDGKVELGASATAHIRTGTLLGQRVLTLESGGSGRLRPSDVIPLSRTGSPYSLTEAVSDFTTNVAGTDTGTLNQSLDTLSATLDRIAPQLGPAFDGVTRLSRSLNARNESLRDLLRNTGVVTRVLAERAQQVNALILNANDLLEVLVQRRQEIVDLLAKTSVVSKQLSGLVHDNESKLAPTLQKLNSVTAMLEKNRDSLGKALPGLAKVEVTVGETVGSGYFYQAFVPNLLPGVLLQPFLDYAFGFRRGVNAGQPPDNAGPRAEFPFPYNGIPPPWERWGGDQ